LRRPSPALVVSVTALIVALGGTSYAAFSVPKNSVGSKQLKKNAVTTKKIKIGAVTGQKIANATITGTQIDLTKLGTVPSATHASSADSATHATNADHATSADNATTVGGHAVRWLLVDNTGAVASQSGGFTIEAHPTAGLFIVNAGSAVSGHAVVASDGLAKDSSFRGVTTAGPCEPAGSADGIDCTGLATNANDGNHILVATTDTTNGTEADHSFYLLVY
jgi:hypothetical protein